MAADLRQGEHIPKMQNDIGRKSKLRVLRQRRSKEGGGGCWFPCRTMPCCAVPGRAARGSARRCVLDSCRKFKLNRKAVSGKNNRCARTFHLRDCILVLYQLRHTSLMNNFIFYKTCTILYNVLYNIIIFSILYNTEQSGA